MPQSINPSDSVIVGNPNAMAMMPEYANGQSFANTMEENPNTTKREDTITPQGNKKEAIVAAFEKMRIAQQAATETPSAAESIKTTPRSQPS